MSTQPLESMQPAFIQEEDKGSDSTEPDIYSLHERRAGRLVLDPAYVLSFLCAAIAQPYSREARVEFGEAFTARLKLTKDGTKILWPQPTDDPEDPQNVTCPQILF